MDVVVSRCARIDIGKAEVVVCLRIPGSRGKRVAQVRTFSAVAGGLDTHVVDLDGRTLLPGFIDPHSHSAEFDRPATK
jgi:imidazolonepropionase-like amidohydrolase